MLSEHDTRLPWLVYAKNHACDFQSSGLPLKSPKPNAGTHHHNTFPVFMVKTMR
jgi:hypothetical protein